MELLYFPEYGKKYAGVIIGIKNRPRNGERKCESNDSSSPQGGINPHRMEGICGEQAHGPSDLFRGSVDEPAKHFQP